MIRRLLPLTVLFGASALASPPGPNGVPPGLTRVCAEVLPDPEPEQVYVSARWGAVSTAPCPPEDCHIGRATVTLAAEGTFAVAPLLPADEEPTDLVLTAAFTWSEVAADADRDLYISAGKTGDAYPIPGARFARTVDLLVTVQAHPDPRRRWLVVLAGAAGAVEEVVAWEVDEKVVAAMRSDAWAVVSTPSDAGTAFHFAIRTDVGFDPLFAMTSSCFGGGKKCYDAEGVAHGELSGH